MPSSKDRKPVLSRKPNFVSHKAHCTICAHPQLENIEQKFLRWESPARIAAEHKLRDRSAVYRHAHAVGLFSQRDRNLRAALGRLIERIDDVKPTASAVVQAIGLYARINTRGELIERDDQVGIHELFEKMSHDEFAAYAMEGTLPTWFPRVKKADSPQVTRGDENA